MTMPNPEYVHALVNHAPLFLLVAALVPLILGLLVGSRASVNAGLLLIVLGAALTFVVERSGENAEERFEHGELSAYVDDVAEAWLHEHEERAEIAVYVVYGTGGLAALTMLIGIGWVKGRVIFGVLTAVAVGVSVGFLGWTAKAGGQIMHAEFRASAEAYPASHADGEHGHDENEDKDDGEGHDADTPPVKNQGQGGDADGESPLISPSPLSVEDSKVETEGAAVPVVESEPAESRDAEDTEDTEDTGGAGGAATQPAVSVPASRIIVKP